MTGLASALAWATAWTALTPAVLRWLPEPAGIGAEADGTRATSEPLPSDEPVHATRARPLLDDGDKIPYRSLITPGFVASITLFSAVASLLIMAYVPPTGWSAWAALSGPGVLACCVDARTTWLPRRLTTMIGIVAGVGVVIQAVLEASPWRLAGALAGALGLGAFFWVFWRLTRGIGYGDVRLMTAVGLVVGAHSLQMTLVAVVLGTALGALWGLAYRVLRGPGFFPYGPPLLAGPFLALVFTAVQG